MFHITIEESKNDVILHCAGRMVCGDETTLLCAATAYFGRDIVLELSQVEAIDAAGVGALISLQAAGIYLQLLNPAKAVRDVLRLTQLDSVLEICGAAGPSVSEDAGLKRSLGLFFSPAVAPAT